VVGSPVTQEHLPMALVCLRCASADCTCGRLDGIAAEAALVEAAVGVAVGGSDDPELEVAALLLAMQRAGEKVDDAL
jgi:hypothetical protein